jgi:LPS O-antigen subunit length determinant protein (WzzB/FepE family)
MNQQEAVNKLKENPQQAKQFNEVAGYLNDAVKKEMATFAKLVQYDVLVQMQKKAVSDGVNFDSKSMNDLAKTINDIVTQINADLEKEFAKKFKEIQG